MEKSCNPMIRKSNQSALLVAWDVLYSITNSCLIGWGSASVNVFPNKAALQYADVLAVIGLGI